MLVAIACSFPRIRQIVSVRRGFKCHLQRYKQQGATGNMTYAISGGNNARGACDASGVVPVATGVLMAPVVPIAQMVPVVLMVSVVAAML